MFRPLRLLFTDFDVTYYHASRQVAHADIATTLTTLARFKAGTNFTDADYQRTASAFIK